MKQRKNKDIIVFFILIPIFLWCAFYLSSRLEGRLPRFSAINKSRSGASVFYETLKELKYPVERTLNPLDSYDSESIQIVADYGVFDINSSEIKDWVSKGGTLVYLAPENFHIMDYGVKPEEKDGLFIYKYKKGTVIASDANFITNKTLMEDTNGAYKIIQGLKEFNGRKIYFNEKHLFSAINKKSFWDYTPMEIKFILYQILLVFIAFFYYKGKRFGKTIPLYEETERSENEYLYSASALYRQAKCYDLILGIYYKNLLKTMNSSHDKWLEDWERENLPYLDKAKRVYDFMHSNISNSGVKEYMQIVTIIEQLKKILKKRRDLYWKTSRKTM